MKKNNESPDLKKTESPDLMVTPPATSSIPRMAYSMEETAQILGVSYTTIHRLLSRGHLRSCNVLRHKVIPRTEIERFLQTTLS